MKATKEKRSLPRFMRNAEKLETNRLKRIQEARDNRSMKNLMKLWASEKLKVKTLTPEQRNAINLLADPISEHSDRYICARIGVTVRTLANWQNNLVFLRELNKEVLKRRTFSLLGAYRNVNRQVRRGSMKDTWKYLEMIGEYSKKHEHKIDDTGEEPLGDDELKAEVEELTSQLANSNVPSEN